MLFALINVVSFKDRKLLGTEQVLVINVVLRFFTHKYNNPIYVYVYMHMYTSHNF